jgi:hypothetical protein
MKKALFLFPLSSADLWNCFHFLLIVLISNQLLSAEADRSRDKAAEAQRHKAEKTFSYIPLSLSFFVPMCLCNYVPALSCKNQTEFFA